MASSQLSILIIAFPEFNTLDIGGPADVFGNFALDEKKFNIKITSSSPSPTQSWEGLKIASDVSLDEAKKTLDTYDVLIMPGGVDIGGRLLKNEFSNVVEIIQQFATLEPSAKIGKRVLMSVCTGALFLGYAGIFAGLKCTTHWKALTGPESLQDMIATYESDNPKSPKATIEPMVDGVITPDQNYRYVEVQDQNAMVAIRQEGEIIVVTEEVPMQCRVISSGGISCAIDASLYLLKLLLSQDDMIAVADMMQYAFRGM